MIMEKYITKNGIKYELRGEQYYPIFPNRNKSLEIWHVLCYNISNKLKFWKVCYDRKL